MVCGPGGRGPPGGPSKDLIKFIYTLHVSIYLYIDDLAAASICEERRGLRNFRSLSGVPTLTPHEIFRGFLKSSSPIANDSQFYPLPDLPGSMRFNPEPKKLLALQIGPDPDFRRFSSTFPQRTWMRKVLAYKLVLLFVWDGSNSATAATLVFAPEKGSKTTFPT